MGWEKVGSQALLANDGDRQVVKVGDQKILVLKHKGQLYATQSRCPHLNLSLKRGKVTDSGALVCPFHRSEFDLKTGEVQTWCPFPPVLGQAFGKLKQENQLSVFPTKIEDGSVWVELS